MDRELLAAVPDDEPRQWFRMVMEQAAPQAHEALGWADAVSLKVEAMDVAALSSVRDALEGKLRIGSLDDQALDVYFDLAALLAGSR